MIKEKQLKHLLEQKNANERKYLALIHKLKLELEEAEDAYNDLWESYMLFEDEADLYADEFY